MEGFVNDKPTRNAHGQAPVQPLQPIPLGTARTLDGTDRQNLADTAVAGSPHEPRSHAPQPYDTQIHAPLPSAPRRSPPAVDERPALPATRAPTWLPLVWVAVGAAFAIGVVLFVALS